MIGEDELLEGLECGEEAEVDEASRDDAYTFDPGPLQPEGGAKETDEINVEGLVSNMDQNYKAKEDDFEKLKLLGKGGYGSVYFVRKKAEPNKDCLYAMKVLKKAKIVSSDKDTAHIRSERNILGKIRHPFIVRLHYAFQTRGKLYLVLEFIQGGELFMMLERKGILEEDVSKMYLAEITLALGYLHQLGIIFRDLKPENILLDADGHIKLIDFGLCKERVSNGNRTYTLCGTIEYMAPEVITKQGHDQSADWWSLGALMFDMLTGEPPFSAPTKRETQELILRGRISQPTGVSAQAKDLLKNLLKRNHLTRLGSGERDALDIQHHCWFKCIDWYKLERKEVPVLYKPPLAGPLDVSFFDQKFRSMAIDADSPSCTPANANLFEGYSFQEPLEFEESFYEPEAVYQNEASRRKKLLAKTSIEESRNGNQTVPNGKKILKAKPGF